MLLLIKYATGVVMMISDMQMLVSKKIKEIEARENVEVMMAIESGSRAWDFASPDSDYDIRFIYVRSATDYLKLEAQRDVIEWQLDETLDISGWDLQKALKLLYRSNPTLFEWASSPIVYYQSPKFEQFKAILPQYFSKKKSLYHYWHMANTNQREFLNVELKQVKIKKYFYVLRAILASQWILEEGTNPPMRFAELVAAKLPQELQPAVAKLLAQKVDVPELKRVARVPELDEYIASHISQMEQQAQTMNELQQNDWEPLDTLFMSLIK